MVQVGFSKQLESAGGSFMSNSEAIRSNSQASDEAVQLRLWQVSCRLTKLDDMILLTTRPENSTSTIIPDPFVLIDIE